jgi:hypothetical protein
MIINGENEIGLNEWNMKNEIMNDDLQINQSITKEITNPNENNEMKNFQTLHIQGKNGEDIMECSLLDFLLCR